MATITNGGTETHPVFVSSGNTLINDGKIKAGHHGQDSVFGGTDVTVENYGSIYASGAAAVQFAAGGHNTFVDEVGSVTRGVVDGGNYAGSGGTSDLVLAAGQGAGTIYGLGYQFIGFQNVIIADHASWLIHGGVGPEAGGITFAGEGMLGIDSPAKFHSTISNFGSYDTIDLTTFKYHSGTTASLVGNDTLEIVSNGHTVDLQLKGDYAGFKFFATADFYGHVEITDVPCYVRGTRIATPAGETTVEALVAGDLIVTASGATRAVKWVGNRTCDPLLMDVGHEVVSPVVFAAGSLGNGLPVRTLRVSPEHALLLNGVLVAARLLVNGTTITQPRLDAPVEYFHVELDSHDVILAEGAAAETYIVESNNRRMFVNADEVSVADADAPVALPCAERVFAGETLKAIRAELQAIADVSVGDLTNDADLHLVVDGRTVRAASLEGRTAVFAIPAGARDIRIASRASVPAEIDAGSSDRRRLGVNVARLVLRDESRSVTVAHTDPALVHGFHTPEDAHRWTTGMGRVPVSLTEIFAGAFSLEIHTGGGSLSYRVGDVAMGVVRAA